MNRAAEHLIAPDRQFAAEASPETVATALLARVFRRRGDNPEPALPSPDNNRPPPPAAVELVFA